MTRSARAVKKSRRLGRPIGLKKVNLRGSVGRDERCQNCFQFKKTSLDGFRARLYVVTRCENQAANSGPIDRVDKPAAQNSDYRGQQGRRRDYGGITPRVRQPSLHRIQWSGCLVAADK